MSTKSIIDEIKLKAPGWDRVGTAKSIASMLTRCQNLLYSKPCRETVFIDPATGNHPLLSTTAGQFDYPLPDVSKVIEGLARDLRLFFCFQVYALGTNVSTVLYLERDGGVIRRETGRQGAKYIYNTTGSEATEEDAARVMFNFDPGTTTDKYRMICTLEPMPIDSESIPLMVSKNYEWALIEGTLGFIEYFDLGRSDRLDQFKLKLAKEFWRGNPAAEGVDEITNTPIRFQ
jgi:hypothetical protein